MEFWILIRNWSSGDAIIGVEIDFRHMSFIESFDLLNRVLPYSPALTFVVLKRYGYDLDPSIISLELIDIERQKQHPNAFRVPQRVYGSYRHKVRYADPDCCSKTQRQRSLRVNQQQPQTHQGLVLGPQYPGLKSHAPDAYQAVTLATGGDRSSSSQNDHGYGTRSSTRLTQRSSELNSSFRSGTGGGSILKNRDQSPSSAPRYDDLCAQDKMALSRLSYEDATKTQSTPDLGKNVTEYELEDGTKIRTIEEEQGHIERGKGFYYKNSFLIEQDPPGRNFKFTPRLNQQGGVAAGGEYNPDYASLRTLEDKYNIDIDDYDKLAYFDQLLKVQNDHLAQSFGIKLPPARVVTTVLENRHQYSSGTGNWNLGKILWRISKYRNICHV